MTLHKSPLTAIYELRVELRMPLDRNEQGAAWGAAPTVCNAMLNGYFH